MAKRSAIAALPTDIRLSFERRLAENGFANYTKLTEWLNQQGYEISRSAVHRYGQKIERRFKSIKASTPWKTAQITEGLPKPFALFYKQKAGGAKKQSLIHRVMNKQCNWAACAASKPFTTLPDAKPLWQLNTEPCWMRQTPIRFGNTAQ